MSLDVARGGITGVLGPNGSGKTTLLRTLSGALTPTSGRVLLDGEPIGRLPSRALARRLAVVPQEIHPVFDYTVLDLALMGRYAHLGPFGFETAIDLLVVRRALAATGTADLEDRHFDTLSGGEKQRVVIASALAQFDEDVDEAGRLLVLDEPTAALDLHYQVEIAQLLRTLAVQRGLTLLVTTHDIQFAWQVCDRIVLLQDGRVLADGPTDATLTPEHLHTLYGLRVDRMTHADGAISLVPAPVSRLRR
ncbi:MAG: ABC transporter ATP-binding protein [Acidobacteria bacterium]|nr:ABC transporter ATP-binding protein [Acidobacteriota bacterium]